MKVEQSMEDSHLPLFIGPLVDKFFDKEAEYSQGGMQTVCGTSQQFLLRFHPKDCQMSPEKHLERLKTWFHS